MLKALYFYFFFLFCSVTINQNFSSSIAALKAKLASNLIPNSLAFSSLFFKAIYLFMRRKLMFNDYLKQVYVSLAQSIFISLRVHAL